MSRTQTVAGVATFSSAITYNSVGRIDSHSLTLAGATRSRAYEYDPLGQLRRSTLDLVEVELYAYDANGNRSSTLAGVATYDEQDRVLASDGVSYTFDDDGFLTARGSDTFVYSAKGELLRATVGGNTIDYSYDGFHRRTARTDAGGTTEYLYGDPGHPFLVSASRRAGVLTRYYYDVGGALFAFERGGGWYYVAADQVGTPVAVFDATGALVKQVDYDSYGQRLANSAPAFDLEIGFAGGIEDVVTGLTRFGYRDFDAASGRWTARDPILYAGGQVNLYAYVGNDPVGLRDPLGLFCIGGSLYEVVGGGSELCYDLETGEASLCAEFGAGFGSELALAAGAPKFDEDIAEARLNIECGPLKLGAKCKKSTRCGGLDCTPIGGLGPFEVDKAGELKASKDPLDDDNVKCGLKGVAKVQSCIRIP